MPTIDRRVVEDHWAQQLKHIKPGDQLVSSRITPDGEFCHDVDDAGRFAVTYLQGRLSVVRDDALKPWQQFMVDWSDKSAPQPTLRVSPNLFDATKH